VLGRVGLSELAESIEPRLRALLGNHKLYA